MTSQWPITTELATHAPPVQEKVPRKDAQKNEIILFVSCVLSLASELLVIFLVRESARARSWPRQGTHEQAPVVSRREENNSSLSWS